MFDADYWRYYEHNQRELESFLPAWQLQHTSFRNEVSLRYSDQDNILSDRFFVSHEYWLAIRPINARLQLYCDTIGYNNGKPLWRSTRTSSSTTTKTTTTTTQQPSTSEPRHNFTTETVERTTTPTLSTSTKSKTTNLQTNITYTETISYDTTSSNELISVQAENNSTTQSGSIVTITIVVVVLVIVLAAFGVAVFFYRRRKEKNSNLERSVHYQAEQTVDNEYGTTGTVYSLETDNQTQGQDSYTYIEGDGKNTGVRSNHSDEYTYVRNMSDARIAPAETGMVENDVYAGGDVYSDDNKTDVQTQQENVSMQENDVYEGGDVRAEYDVYTGTHGANQDGGIAGKQNEGNNLEEGNPYDFYKGSTSVNYQQETGDITDDVIMYM